MASRLPPFQPGSMWFWCPVSATAQQPYAALPPMKLSLSVIANRPVGVGVEGLPTATRKLFATAPLRYAVTRRCERSARIDHGLATMPAALDGIQAVRPFGSAVDITRSQLPRSPSAASTVRVPHSVRRRSFASRRPEAEGLARRTVARVRTATG